MRPDMARTEETHERYSEVGLWLERTIEAACTETGNLIKPLEHATGGLTLLALARPCPKD